MKINNFKISSIKTTHLLEIKLNLFTCMSCRHFRKKYIRNQVIHSLIMGILKCNLITGTYIFWNMIT